MNQELQNDIIPILYPDHVGKTNEISPSLLKRLDIESERQVLNPENEIEMIMLSFMVKDEKYIKTLLESGVDSKWFFNKELKAFFQKVMYFYNTHKILFSKKLFLEQIEAKYIIKKIENPIISQYEQFYDDLLSYDFTDDDFVIKLKEWREYVVQQRIKKAFKDYSDKINSGETVIGGYESLSKEIISLGSTLTSDKTYRIASLGKDAKKVFEDFYNRKENPELFCGYTTGFDALDERFSGIEKGKMTVIMGMSSSGKTTLARNITRHIQKKHNARICVISCEESNLDYMAKIVCAELNISLKTGKGGSLNDKQLEDILEIAEKFAEEDRINGSCYEIIEVDARKYTIEELESIIESEYGKQYFDVVLLDHLSLVKASANKSDSEHIELGDVAKFFRNMAKRHNFAGILIAQANRNSAKFVRGKREVDMYLENIEGSNKPGQDTDKAIAVRLRSDDPTIAVVRVVKDREGERDYDIELANSLHYCKFENLSVRHDYMGEITQEIYDSHQITIDDEGRPVNSRTGELVNIPMKEHKPALSHLEEEVPSVLKGLAENNGLFKF